MRLALALLATILTFSSAHAEITPASSKIEPIPDQIWKMMRGKSWNDEIKACAGREDLVLLTLPYWDFTDQAKIGHLIVHKSVGSEVRDVFVQMFRDKSYNFERMELIDVYGGNDRASMGANNTSAYNCRVVSGTTRLSSHGRGLAIDINPIQNPYVTLKITSPPAGKPWDTPDERRKAKSQKGLILKDSAITKAFKAKGWYWGGEWKNSKDYQHFSKDGK
jgi:hypothetical protein